jgi:hypothetical protein
MNKSAHYQILGQIVGQMYHFQIIGQKYQILPSSSLFAQTYEQKYWYQIVGQMYHFQIIGQKYQIFYSFS